ncbi:MAG: hypothetical protein ABIV28_05550, partial [Longimicrobiales bacterium]
FPPLGGSAGPRTSDSQDGSLSLTGGAVSLFRMAGPASLKVSAASYEAENTAGRGTYAGVDAVVGLSLGAADLSLGMRRWNTPVEHGEIGAYAAVGVAVGKSAYIQGSASRSVTDPESGAPGSNAFSVGMSLRVGGRSLGAAPAAAAGAVTGAGRAVTFTIRDEQARSVAVAGDFSGWEPRAL